MAAAHVVPTLEVSTADDMDIHSDNGLYYDDGDIELDLELPPTYGQDDDVDINDAASVHEEDGQEVAEEDDFMVDSEDVIDEDYDDQGDEGVAIVGQPTIDNTATIEVETPEDLIDYTDEEEALKAELRQAKAMAQSRPEAVQDDQAEEAVIQQDEIPADMQALLSVDANKSQSPHAYAQSAFDHTIEAQEHEERNQSPAQRSYHSDGGNENVHTDGGEGGVLLQGQDEYAHDEGDHEDAAYQDYAHQESAEDNEDHDQDASGLPSVTVNVEGNELWLFKQHDHDDSGDWLIDDISLAKTSMSDLFRACRSSLGEDVSNESEIGFRFDHLHNMELYEDNTACVAVSLERLVNYYHALMAQDDINEPDSFYISVLFRPRFVTLLSDIAKFADQESGYTALEAAVAAGETHFSTVISSASSDEPTEWGNEEQAQEQANGEDQEQAEEEVHVHDDEQEDVFGEVQQEVHEGEHDHGKEDDAQEDYEGQGADVHKSEESSAEHEAREDHGDHSPQTANIQDVPAANDQKAASQPEPAEPAPRSHTTTPASEAYRSLPDDDLIDYTDEEDEILAATKQAEQTPTHATSPSSVTVRGDESAHAEEHHSTASSPKITQQEEQDYLTHDEVTIEVGQQPDIQSGRAQPAQNDEAEEPYQDNEAEQLFQGDETEQLHQGDDTEQLYQGDEAEESYQGDEAEESYQGDEAEESYQDDEQAFDKHDANQDHADWTFEDLHDEQPELDFMDGDEFNTAGDTTVDGNDYPGTEDFLDFDTEWAAGQDLDTTVHAGGDDIDYGQDEEDGVAAQPANAASPAAEPTTASSLDAKNASPQGQKRSIDEAGHGADNALDSIGMFAYSPCRKRFMAANFFLPDAKRPRV
jgi:hypothetical protein